VRTRFTALRFRLDHRTPTASTGHALAVKNGVQSGVPAQTGFPPNVPLPPRCQIPSVGALGQDFHLRFVFHASRTTPPSRTCSTRRSSFLAVLASLCGNYASQTGRGFVRARRRCRPCEG
jgi:hypothetical protein